MPRGRPPKPKQRIGVAITERNRYKEFKVTYDNIVASLPKDAVLVIVDDASTEPFPEATFRFDHNVGIARAKNKCIELLYDAGCTHFFLFDSDCYPIVNDWTERYINTGVPHLSMTFNKHSSGKPNGNGKASPAGDGLVHYENPCGCMIYLTRECVDTVGGMDVRYGKWGFDHVDYSKRIYNAGLTPYPFMDIKDSQEIFYSYDYHNAIARSVDYQTRAGHIARNATLYKSLGNSAEYHPFRKGRDIVITTLFTGVEDPQRGEKWEASYELIRELHESCQSHGVELVLLTDDEFTYPDIDVVLFDKADTNPYFQRWISISDFLDGTRDIDRAWCVDATDVELLRNPWENMTGGTLHTGYEPSKVNNRWLSQHHGLSAFSALFNKYGRQQLLNAGIVGGEASLVQQFAQDIVDLYEANGRNLGLTDMAAFNDIAYRKYSHLLNFGSHICTEFKKYDKGNKVAIWRHK